MKSQNLKKFFILGGALALTVGLSGCHYGHGRGHGYHGPSHGHAKHHDGGRYDRDDRGRRGRGDRRHRDRD